MVYARRSLHLHLYTCIYTPASIHLDVLRLCTAPAPIHLHRYTCRCVYRCFHLHLYTHIFTFEYYDNLVVDDDNDDENDDDDDGDEECDDWHPLSGFGTLRSTGTDIGFRSNPRVSTVKTTDFPSEVLCLFGQLLDIHLVIFTGSLWREGKKYKLVQPF